MNTNIFLILLSYTIAFLSGMVTVLIVQGMKREHEALYGAHVPTKPQRDPEAVEQEATLTRFFSAPAEDVPVKRGRPPGSKNKATRQPALNPSSGTIHLDQVPELTEADRQPTVSSRPHSRRRH